jgi:hypothetical protein
VANSHGRSSSRFRFTAGRTTIGGQANCRLAAVNFEGAEDGMATVSKYEQQDHSDISRRGDE